jgi:DNA polymerase III sliding clamp (beta) subunit (PCNA family)
MEVKRETLIEMLGGLKPAIPAKGDEDMTKRVVFTGKDAVAYSDSMCVVWPFETDFRTVAPSDEIIQILSRMSGEMVQLIYSKDCINLKAGRIKARIKTEPASRVLEDVDKLLASTETDWFEPPGNFIDALALCMYTTSKDTTQRALMCVSVNGDNMISSDDFRISHHKLNAPMGHAILIPQAACLEIVKNALNKEDPNNPPVCTYAVTDTWCMFNADTNRNIMVASRVVSEPYGDVMPFFDFEGDIYKLPDKVKDHIDAVSVMAEGEYDILKEISVHMDTGKVLLNAERDLGWVKAEIDDDGFTPAAPATFTINPDFFKEILGRTQHLKLGTDKGLFEEGDFRHLVSLTVV